MRRRLFGRDGDNSAAVAPIVALSLFALIGAGGIAFDYSRLASLDTELQQAADQAALAAATQLDRSDGARDRATNAITDDDDTKRLAANFTRFANDGSSDGTAVEIGDIKFCSAFDDSVEDTNAACDEIDADDDEGDGDARFVVVSTEVRTANYALTPIVGAFFGDAQATAVAGVESSICNVAPLLVCAPEDNPDWPTDADIGVGMRLKPGPHTGAWAPGNFGLLDFGNGNPAVIDALQGFGLNGCQSTDDTVTEPGVKDVTDAINTRMDVYDKGDASVCNPSTGYGCPAKSARKDMMIDVTPNNGPTIVKTTSDASNPPATPTQAEIDAAASTLSCPADPKGASLTFQAPVSPERGLSRDGCHYTPAGCPTTETEPGGNIGDKNWDRDGYFLQNYGWDSASWPTNTGLPSNATRYQVYLWELQDTANRLATKKFATIGSPKITAAGKTYTWAVKAHCSYPAPKYGSTAYAAQKDRRILTVIAANCEGMTGKSGADHGDFVILRAFDVFLTEPSTARTDYPAAGQSTDKQEIYGEIIGPAEPLGGGGGFQYYSRSRPYLVR